MVKPTMLSKFRTAAPIARVPASAVPLLGHRLLIVDDHHDSADSMGMLIAMLGAEVRVAYDGPHALDVADAWPPDSVLIDLAMPQMDGWELARRLRVRHRGLKLFAVSGLEAEVGSLRARAAHFDRHLLKPLDIEALLRSLLADD